MGSRIFCNEFRYTIFEELLISLLRKTINYSRTGFTNL